MSEGNDEITRLQRRVRELEEKEKKNNMWLGLVFGAAVILIWIYTLSLL